MNQKYYERFKFFTESFYWDKYLNWAYNTCTKDLDHLNFYPEFTTQGFTTMLCGTSGERTSSIFVEYIFSRNDKTHFIILDHSPVQINESKTLLSGAFPDAHIQYLITDAVETGLPTSSVDHIETDAFFQFFSQENLGHLLTEWKRILKPGGWVTTRVFASHHLVEKRLDFIRLWVARYYLGVDIYVHDMPDIIETIQRSGLLHVQGGHAWCPTFKRFSLLNPE